MDSIDEYEDTKLSLNQELNELELEVGPVKYIAALIYEDPESQLDEAVRIVIIAFIFVFDPMAILLLMAGNYTLMGRIGAAPTTPAPPKKKKIVPNAKMEFVPAEVLAEVVAETIDEKIPPKPEPPKNEIVKEHEVPRWLDSAKAKSIEIPAEPHGHGIHSPQFYKDK